MVFMATTEKFCVALTQTAVQGLLLTGEASRRKASEPKVLSLHSSSIKDLKSLISDLGLGNKIFLTHVILQGYYN